MDARRSRRSPAYSGCRPHDAPRIYPTFRYRDAAAIIAWLTDVFAFTVHARYDDGAGQVQHAELAFGSSMIMLGTLADDPYGAMVGTAVTPGAKSVYVAVDDADALFARAEAAGATILEGLTERSYGSREFIVARAHEPQESLVIEFTGIRNDGRLSAVRGQSRQKTHRICLSRLPFDGK